MYYIYIVFTANVPLLSKGCFCHCVNHCGHPSYIHSDRQQYKNMRHVVATVAYFLPIFKPISSKVDILLYLKLSKKNTKIIIICGLVILLFPLGNLVYSQALKKSSMEIILKRKTKENKRIKRQ